MVTTFLKVRIVTTTTENLRQVSLRALPKLIAPQSETFIHKAILNKSHVKEKNFQTHFKLSLDVVGINIHP